MYSYHTDDIYLNNIGTISDLVIACLHFIICYNKIDSWTKHCYKKNKMKSCENMAMAEEEVVGRHREKGRVIWYCFVIIIIIIIITGTGCPVTLKYGRTPPNKHGDVGQQQHVTDDEWIVCYTWLCRGVKN